MNTPTRVIALGTVVMMSGCFHVTSNLDTDVVPVSELRATRVADVPVPGSQIVTVATTLEGTLLSIEASFEERCRTTTFETWQNFDKTVTTLPATHWLMFGSGLLAAAGGGATLGLGSVYAATPSDSAVLDPSVEQSRDTGQWMMLIGGAVTGLGVALLASEVADAVALEDYRTPTDQVVKPLQGQEVVCHEGPAKQRAVWIETPPTEGRLAERTTVVTDDAGRATIDLRDPAFDGFSHGDPFAVVACEHCIGWNLSLLPETAGDLAIYRDDVEALRGWVAQHSGHSDAQLVARVTEAHRRREVVVMGDAITFRTGSASLQRSAGPHLDRTAEFLLKRRHLQLRIEGHTDTTGSTKKNRTLSKRRAEAVKRYLVQRGVPGERLITVGLADSRPIKSNRTGTGRRANRRYQFQLLED